MRSSRPSLRCQGPAAVRFACGLALLTFLVTSRAEDTNPGLTFFEKHIRPVLVDRCYECHSAQSEKLKGGLRLDSKSGLLKGGNSGQPAIVPHDPERSLLITAISHLDDKLQMPPRAKLNEEIVRHFVEWVKMGAPDPRTGDSSATQANPMAATNHWAFHSPKAVPLPAVQNRDWPRHPIDFFILARLETASLSPAPAANRRTLLRRATFDLHGLPPTAAEVAEFESDPSSNAWEKVIDRLLNSPRYGERWARHWLDVARYADTKGYVYSDRESERFSYSYAYRDWVIRALNEDLPYDRFLKLQIAADQLDATDEDLPAMGFLTLGRRFLSVKPDIIDDRIDVLTRGTQALTVACARCHDHKFDPVPTADYYSLYGVLDSSTEFVKATGRHSSPDAAETYEKKLAELTTKYTNTLAEVRQESATRARARTTDYLRELARIKDIPTDEFYEILGADELNPAVTRRWWNYIADRTARFDPIFTPWKILTAIPPKEFAAKAREVWTSIKAGHNEKLNPLVVAALDKSDLTKLDDLATAYGTLLLDIDKKFAETKKPFDAPAEEALRLVFHGPDAPILAPNGSYDDWSFFFDEGGRVKLGQMIRAIEEWQIDGPGAPPHAGLLIDRDRPREPYIFKRGNPANRGEIVPRQFLSVISGAGRQPFQNGSGRLELAERIASRDNPLTARVMINRVWMHHFGAGLVKSASDFGTRSDPPSHPELLDHLALQFMNEGWSLKKLHRAIMLSAAYQQSSQPQPALAEQAQLADPENRLLWKFNRRRLEFEALRDSLLAVTAALDPRQGGKPADLFRRPFSARRTVYGFINRVNLPGVLPSFDFANPDLHIPQRSQTTVPQQALFLLNGPFTIERAQALAARHQELPRKSRIKAMYESALQRTPSEQELSDALTFLKTVESEPLPEKPKVEPSVWSYGYGPFDTTARKLTSFTPLPKFEKDSWQGGENWPDPALGWLRLTAQGGHPEQDRAIVRRWTAPADCRVNLAGKIEHQVDQGDGITALVIHSRHGELASWNVRNQKADANFENIEFKKGDHLDFVVSSRQTISYDDFIWPPALTRTDLKPAAGEKAQAWVAKNDFAGPQLPPVTPLEPWPALAQVLLLSNEFVFVD